MLLMMSKGLHVLKQFEGDRDNDNFFGSNFFFLMPRADSRYYFKLVQTTF